MSAINLPLEEPDDTAAKFRNYVPKDRSLRELTLEPAAAGVLDDIFKMLNELREQQKTFNMMEDDEAEADIMSLAPKNPNWDLKRDVEQKLARLEHRTQRAIVELIQERFGKQSANDSGQLSSAINALERTMHE